MPGCQAAQCAPEDDAVAPSVPTPIAIGHTVVCVSVPDDASQSTAALSAVCRRHRPPSNLVRGRSRRCVTLSGCRRSHTFQLSVMSHFFRHVPHWSVLSEYGSVMTVVIWEVGNREVGLSESFNKLINSAY